MVPRKLLKGHSRQITCPLYWNAYIHVTVENVSVLNSSFTKLTETKTEPKPFFELLAESLVE